MNNPLIACLSFTLGGKDNRLRKLCITFSGLAEWLGAWLELRLLTGDREEWGVADEDRFNGVEESVF